MCKSCAGKSRGSCGPGILSGKTRCFAVGLSVLFLAAALFSGCDRMDVSPNTQNSIQETTPAPPSISQRPLTDAESTINWGSLTEQQIHQILADHPDNAKAWMELGRFYLNASQGTNAEAKRKLELADQALNKAIKLNPDNREIYFALDQVYQELIYKFRKEFPIKRRQRFLEELIDRFPDDPRAPLALASMYNYELNLPLAAEEWAKKALKLSQQKNYGFLRRRAQQLLGRIYMKRGKTSRAEYYFTEAAKGLKERKPTGDQIYWACPYSALGELYTMLDKPNKAAKSYMDAADLERDQKDKQLLAAYKAYVAGDYKNTLKYIDRTLALERKSTYLEFRGYILLYLRRYKKAKSLFDEILSKDPSDIGARVGHGHLAIINKNYRYADELFKDAEDDAVARIKGVRQIQGWLQTDVDLARLTVEMIYLGQAWIEANQNRHETAIEFYDKALNVSPDNLLAQLGKANSLGGAKRLDLAEEAYREILKTYPENPHALSEMGRILFNKGLDEEAEKYYKRALEIDSGHYTCPYEGLGLVYLKRGKTDLARKNFEKAVKINPNMEYKKLNGLAEIYINEGKYKKARKLLEKSMENYPYDEEAKKLIKKLDSAVNTKRAE